MDCSVKPVELLSPDSVGLSPDDSVGVVSSDESVGVVSSKESVGVVSSDESVVELEEVSVIPEESSVGKEEVVSPEDCVVDSSVE